MVPAPQKIRSARGLDGKPVHGSPGGYIENAVTDRRGLVAYSAAWIEYWRKTTDRSLSSEETRACSR